MNMTEAQVYQLAGMTVQVKLNQITEDFHPYCMAFPWMTKQEYKLFKEDIKEHGLIEPIVLCEGMILDGKHRYIACLEVGVNPVFIPYPGPDDPMCYVISRNARRDHLSEGFLDLIDHELNCVESDQKVKSESKKAEGEQLTLL